MCRSILDVKAWITCQVENTKKLTASQLKKVIAMKVSSAREALIEETFEGLHSEDELVTRIRWSQPLKVFTKKVVFATRQSSQFQETESSRCCQSDLLQAAQGTAAAPRQRLICVA